MALVEPLVAPYEMVTDGAGEGITLSRKRVGILIFLSGLVAVAAVAGVTIGSIARFAPLRHSSVSVFAYQDESVMTSALRDGAVTESKLGYNSVTSSKIHDGSVTAEKLRPYSVGSSTIMNESIKGNHLTSSCVGSYAIMDEAITSDKLRMFSVTTTKLDDRAVTSEKLASNSVARTHLMDNSVISSKLAIGLDIYGARLFSTAPVSSDKRFEIGITSNQATVGFNSPDPSSILGFSNKYFKSAYITKVYNSASLSMLPQGSTDLQTITDATASTERILALSAVRYPDNTIRLSFESLRVAFPEAIEIEDVGMRASNHTDSSPPKTFVNRDVITDAAILGVKQLLEEMAILQSRLAALESRCQTLN